MLDRAERVRVVASDQQDAGLADAGLILGYVLELALCRFRSVNLL